MHMLFPRSLTAHSSKLLVLLAVSTASLVAAPTAGADPATVITHEPFVFTTVSPCTGESASGAGFLHIKEHIDISPSGDFHGAVELNVESAQAVTVTGARYVLTEAFAAHANIDSDLAPQNLNQEVTAHFTRIGEDGTFILGDDFVLRMRIQFTVNANGVVTVDNVEFTEECR
jgi:hypothetical protein